MKAKKRMIVVKTGNFNFRKHAMMCCGFAAFSRQ